MAYYIPFLTDTKPSMHAAATSHLNLQADSSTFAKLVEISDFDEVARQ